MRIYWKLLAATWLIGCCALSRADAPKPETVRFSSGALTLGGELYLPDGDGPFPTVLFNHGSAPGMHNSAASAAIAPYFTARGWAFFMPYRRGQGLSQDQGVYIVDAIKSTRWTGFGKSAKKLVELMSGDHLDDQMAALQWLRQQPFTDPARIATLGNSFGGIQVMLGMAQADYCAGANAAGAAESWNDSKELQSLLKQAAANAKAPVVFFQAENDYDLTPSRELAAAMQAAGKTAELKIYPKYGAGSRAGHSFAYKGVSQWFDDIFAFLDRHCRVGVA